MKKLLAVLVTLLSALPVCATENNLRLLPILPGKSAFTLLPMGTMPLFQVGTTNPGHTAGGGGGGISGTFTATRIPFASGASALTDDADLTFATDTLTVTKIATTTFTGAPIIADDVVINLGTTNSTAFPAIQWNTTQTVDTGMLLTGTTSNHWVIAERQDNSFDFAHGQATDPTLFIHSHNQNTTQWFSARHDGTNSVIATGTGALSLQPSGASILAVNGSSSQVNIRSNSTFGFSSTTAPETNAADTILTRETAATWQMGVDLNGAAIAQTLKACDGITGTDIAGCNLTLAGGRGTGAGTVSDVVVSTGTGLATGTTAQVLVPRLHIEGGLRALTDATATTVFTVTTGNDLSCGGTMFFTVEAADASNQQTTSGSVNFAAADNAAGAGGEACAAAVTGTNSSAATSGTLTVTADATTGTDLCNIRLTATGSLTESVGPRVRYSIVFNPTSSTCAVNPQ